MSIKKMIGQLNDQKELMEFAEAQYATIVKLTKEKEEIELKLRELENHIANATPTLVSESGLISFDNYMEDEEIIARQELRKLKDISQRSPLTMEEAKKVDIYSKIIDNIRKAGKKVIEPDYTDVSTEDLLKQITDGNGTKK